MKTRKETKELRELDQKELTGIYGGKVLSVQIIDDKVIIFYK